MPKFRFVVLLAYIPAGPDFVRVMYGEKYAHGFSIAVAFNASKSVSDLTFLTAADFAKTVAGREGIRKIIARK